MTLLVELKKELRKTEQARKEFETKVATLRQKETRIRQLAAAWGTKSAPLNLASGRTSLPWMGTHCKT